jgi:hypothetical protein
VFITVQLCSVLGSSMCKILLKITAFWDVAPCSLVKSRPAFQRPSMRHCLFVAEGLHALFEAESYADGSVAAGRFYHVRQVKA